MSSSGKVRLWLLGAVTLAVVPRIDRPAMGQEDSWAGTPQDAFLESPIVAKYQCVTCHTIAAEGGTVGPNLNLVGLRRSEEWLRRWLTDPNSVKSGTKMPTFPFSKQEFEMTVGYLSRMTRPLRTEEILASDDPPASRGERLFADYDCYACHRVGDRGRFVGPDLTWVGIRKAEAWERLWLRDPPAFKPGTFMPDFGIPEEGVRDLAAFLHSLQGQENEAGRQWEFMVSFLINTKPEDRGEMVWKRLACWACHGEKGKGGIRNPGAAPGHELVPGLGGVRDRYAPESFRDWILRGTSVPAVRGDAVPLPYACPSYPPEAVDEQELGDLWAYVVSLGPPKRRWTFK